MKKRYTVVLLDGCFCGGYTNSVYLEHLTPEEMNMILDIASRGDETPDVVVRPEWDEKSEDA